ncbi:MAG: hypothetical protein HFJ17_02410 [Clostridia bacterium]|nr:hypothetical protein [Clostridia bacterium]
MAKVHMQYKNDGFATVSNISGLIRISAPTWRAKRWAIKQVKRHASSFGIKLKRKNGVWYADPAKMREAEYRLFKSLEGCWVSPTSFDLRCVNKRTILDKAF